MITELAFSPAIPLVAITAMVLYWGWKRWKHARIRRLQLEQELENGD